MTGGSSQTIIVNQTPSISVATSSNPICQAIQSATLTAGGSATTYSWVSGPNTATYAIGPLASNTTYTVVGTLGTCTNAASITQSVYVCMSLNELDELDKSFMIYPNPVSKNLNIRSNNNHKGKIEITVIDLIGRVQLKQDVIFDDQNVSYQLNIETLPKGVYFIKLKTESGASKVNRILKE